MGKIKVILIVVAVLCITTKGYAQYDAQLSQYWALPSYYNPGAAGSTDKLNINAATRQQWLGMPGAPKTFLIMGDMPFKLFKQQHGVGLIISTEKIGLFSNTALALQYSFKVKILGGQLGLGLQLGMINQVFNGSEVYIPESEYHNQTDDGIPTNEVKGMGFDLGFGIYYTHKYFWTGISAQHLTSPTITFDEKYETYIPSSYYFSAGGNIPFKNSLIILQPSMLLKTTFQTFQVEFGAIVKYNKFVWGGLSYRLNDALIFTVGGEWKGIKLGYSYDYALSDIVKATSGSHEVFVGYSMKLDLGKKTKNKHKSIRIL